jgi:hypothetical protein
MVGNGSPMFAVWSYVIAKMRPDPEVGAQVDINPKVLAFLLGEQESVVESVVAKLCSPDPGSRSKIEDGRRLAKVGTFSYRVVNGKAYMDLRNENERRVYNRKKQQESRAKKKPAVALLPRGQCNDGKNMDNPTWTEQ